MMSNHYLRRFLLTLLIFAGFVPLLHAQNIGAENADPRFLQRLVWTGGEYALRFEVVVQREVNGRYIAHLREFTELPFIEVSLPTGSYRFQVTSYNILDKPEEVSQWVPFQVHQAAPDMIASSSDGTPGIKDEAESKHKKTMLLFAGAAWAPVLPIHGDFFGKGFSPLGAGARFGAAFPGPRGIHLGAEATAFWHKNNTKANNASSYITNTDNDDLDGSGNVFSAGANLLAVKWLQNQTTALTFRLGGSFIVLQDTQERLVFNIGASYLWRFSGNFLLEAGFDYASRLEEYFLDGCIRPWIGVGMVF